MSYYFDKDGFLVQKGDVVYADDLNGPLTSIDVQQDLLVDDIRTDNRLKYGPDSGVANAYIVTLALPLAGYVDGLKIWLKPSATNTGASTINVNTLGVVPIVNLGGRPVDADELKINYWVALKYLAGSFQIVSPTVDARQAVLDAEASAVAAAVSASDSATSASESSSSASSSLSSANTAEGHKNSAETAMNKAEDWAEETEDTEVEIGKYSSLHHAAKSEGFAAAAAASAVSAETINKNLLIDPSFLINPEGYVDGTAIPKDTYSYAMWRGRSVNATGLSIVSNDNDFVLDNSVSGDESWLWHWNNKIADIPDGTTMTVSVTCTAISASSLVFISGLGIDLTITTTGVYSYTFTKDTSGSLYPGPINGEEFIILLNDGCVCTLSGLKLEESDSASKASRPQEEEELRKSNSYLWRIEGGGGVSVGLGFRPNVANSADFSVKLPVKMVSIPTVIGAYLSTEQLASPNNIDQVVSVAVKNTTNSDLLSLRATTNNDLFTYGDLLNIYIADAFYLQFDARYYTT